MNNYHQTNKQRDSFFAAAPFLTRRAKRRTWAAASVILAKPQAITRHIGTRY